MVQEKKFRADLYYRLNVTLVLNGETERQQE
jgi:transcriptional regulator with PAS, ATPase and Fis domain